MWKGTLEGNKRVGQGCNGCCRQHAPDGKFSKCVGFGRSKGRVGLKTRPCVFALNRASMRDLPSVLTRAKKIDPSSAIAGGSAFDILPLVLQQVVKRYLQIALKHRTL